MPPGARDQVLIPREAYGRVYLSNFLQDRARNVSCVESMTPGNKTADGIRGLLCCTLSAPKLTLWYFLVDGKTCNGHPVQAQFPPASSQCPTARARYCISSIPSTPFRTFYVLHLNAEMCQIPGTVHTTARKPLLLASRGRYPPVDMAARGACFDWW